MKNEDRAQEEWLKRQALFSLYLNGDADSTRALFQSLTKTLEGYFHVRLGRDRDDEAQDLVQATLLKIHFARDRFDPKQSLKTWVFTIASRTLIDHWRGLSADHERLDHDSEEGAEGLDQGVEAIPSQILDPSTKTELHHDLNQALEKLKPTERSIVYLYGVEGLSMAEIAQALSITETAAKLRAHRAYKELRVSLGTLLLVWIGSYL